MKIAQAKYLDFTYQLVVIKLIKLLNNLISPMESKPVNVALRNKKGHGRKCTQYW